MSLPPSFTYKLSQAQQAQDIGRFVGAELAALNDKILALNAAVTTVKPDMTLAGSDASEVEIVTNSEPVITVNPPDESLRVGVEDNTVAISLEIP